MFMYDMRIKMLTLYRARLSRHWLCLIILPVVETFVLILLVVTAGAVDVVVDVAAEAADAFTRPIFFKPSIEPFNKSGLSTSGPPNSWSCCNQQHNIASIPSSTCSGVSRKWRKYAYTNNHIINSITIHVNNKLFSESNDKNWRTDTHMDMYFDLIKMSFTLCIPNTHTYIHTEKKTVIYQFFSGFLLHHWIF